MKANRNKFGRFIWLPSLESYPHWKWNSPWKLAIGHQFGQSIWTNHWFSGTMLVAEGSKITEIWCKNIFPQPKVIHHVNMSYCVGSEMKYADQRYICSIWKEASGIWFERLGFAGSMFRKKSNIFSQMVVYSYYKWWLTMVSKKSP